MSITKYEVFEAVAQTLNFSKASVVLNMSQSAVSKSIKSLEDEYGLPLFNREKYGVSLTRFAKSLRPEIQGVLNQERRIKRLVNAHNNILEGKLIIGSFSSASAIILPNLIQQYSSVYPEIQVEIREGHYDEIKRWLEDGLIDVALLIEEFIDDYEKQYLFTDQIKLLAPKEFNLEDQLSINAIEKYPFIVTEHYPNPYLSSLIKKYSINPNTKYVVKTNHTVFAFIKKGLGIALLPESAIYNSNHDIHVISLKEEITRNIYMATKKKNLMIPSVKALWALKK